MKKIKLLSLLLGSMLVFTACGSKEVTAPAPTVETTAPATQAPANGEAFSGTLTRESLYETSKGDVVVTEMTFENGKPVDLKVDVRLEDGQMKSEVAKAGNYVMVEGGTPWNEQIDALVAFVKENNFDTSKVNLTTDQGNTDAVTGVSIKVSAYLEAIDEMIAEGTTGQVADGFTGAKVGEVKGEKDTTVATVIYEHGTPVNVKFNTLNADGTNKYDEAKAGNYVMVEGGTPWNEQVDALAAFIVENNFDLTKVSLTNAEGNTDAVTGVSIKVPDLLKAVEEALK